jgi:hypothetical protein
MPALRIVRIEGCCFLKKRNRFHEFSLVPQHAGKGAENFRVVRQTAARDLQLVARFGEITRPIVSAAFEIIEGQRHVSLR